MSVSRFYCPVSLPTSGLFELPADAAHHALRVLRLREKDAVQVFDGDGEARDARIHAIQGKHVQLMIIKACDVQTPGSLHIVLAQAMTSSEKMDWIVQKAVELGAAEIQPIQASRSVAKLTQERMEKRIEHWRGVVISACEQCGRNNLMPVNAPLELSHWLAEEAARPGSKFILHPSHAVALHHQPNPQGRVSVLIGPEGGFTEDEITMAQQAGFQSILLGPRILRTETAAIAAISALQTLWGDFL